MGKEGSRYVKGYSDLFDKLADSYKQSGNQEKALEILTKGTEILPYVGLSHFFLGMFYFEDKDYNKAIEIFKNSKIKDPTMDWLVEYYISIAYNLQGDHEKALDNLEKIAKEPEVRPEILREAIRICLKTGNKSRAESFLKTWLKYHPNDQEALSLQANLNQYFNN